MDTSQSEISLIDVGEQVEKSAVDGEVPSFEIIILAQISSQIRMRMVQWMVETNSCVNKEMKCSRRRKDTMHFFSLHLFRENDTVKSLKMAVAVTKYRYIAFRVELSNLNSTRFDSVVKETDSIRFDSLNMFLA